MLKRLLVITLCLASCRTVRQESMPVTTEEQRPPDHQQVVNQRKARNALAMADLEPIRARNLFLTINPDLLAKEDRHLYRTLQKKFSFIRLDKESLGLGSGNITAVATDDEDIWVGDVLGSFSRYSLATEELLILREGRASTEVKSLNAILVEPSDVWGVASDRIIHYDKKKGRVSYIDRPSMIGYPWDLVRYQGRLILANQNGGLWEYNGERFTESPLNHRLLKSVNKLFVYEGNLYAGSTNGLWLYRQKSWQEIPFFKGQNVLSLTDEQGHLWVGTDRNLYEYNNGRPTARGLDQGWVRALLVQQNNLFAGMMEGGLARFNEEQINPEQKKFTDLSPALFRIGALAYFEPYLIIGTLGNSLFLMHKSLF